MTLSLEQKAHLICDIRRAIEEKRMLSFIDIETIFKENNFAYEGSCMVNYPGFDSTIVWDGWCEEAANLLIEMENAGITAVIPAASGRLQYMTRGKELPLPVVSKPGDYTEEKWLPSYLTIPEAVEYYRKHSAYPNANWFAAQKSWFE